MNSIIQPKKKCEKSSIKEKTKQITKIFRIVKTNRKGLTGGASGGSGLLTPTSKSRDRLSKLDNSGNDQKLIPNSLIAISCEVANFLKSRRSIRGKKVRY